MGTEAESQLVKVLTSVVDDLKELQAAGRMRDPESRAHIDFLERSLRHAQERLASCRHARKSGDRSCSGDRRRIAS